MVELFIAGDPLFMGMLSIPLLVIIVLALNPYHQLLNRFDSVQEAGKRKKMIRSVGLFALMFGIFSQLLGLYGALESIRVWGEVKASMLFQGLGVSTINSGYGVIIFGLAWLITYSGKKTTTATH